MVFFVIYLLPMMCFATNDAGGAIFGIMWMVVYSMIAWVETGRRAQAFIWGIKHETV